MTVLSGVWVGFFLLFSLMQWVGDADLGNNGKWLSCYLLKP